MRFYLTGRLAVEGRRHVDQADLPGRQGRLALVHLVVERHRPVPLDQLADAVWGTQVPPSWETSLRAIVSKLRHALGRASPDLAIVSDAGCYQARLGDPWIDLEVAVNAVDLAEGAFRRGDRGQAWSEATVAAGIAARPLLAGEDLPWIGDLRARTRTAWLRALEILAHIYLDDRQYPLALDVANQIVEAEPYRESGHRHLMRAHLANGDRAEAVRVYSTLRASLREELGVEPSPSTHAVYLDVLRSDATAG